MSLKTINTVNFKKLEFSNNNNIDTTALITIIDANFLEISYT